MGRGNASAYEPQKGNDAGGPEDHPSPPALSNRSSFGEQRILTHDVPFSQQEDWISNVRDGLTA